MKQQPRELTNGPPYVTDPPMIPAELERWVRPIGIEAAVELLLTCGGAPVYLADNPSERSQVAAVIGIDNARALAQEMGRGSIRVPTGKKWLANHFRAMGYSVASIARKLHTTDVTVRSYLKANMKNNQLKLL